MKGKKKEKGKANTLGQYLSDKRYVAEVYGVETMIYRAEERKVYPIQWTLDLSLHTSPNKSGTI